MAMRKLGGGACRVAIQVSLLTVLALLATGVAAQTGAATGATIRPGDVLQMVVPGRADLDRALVVDAAGNVEVPQVGEVRLEGLELGEAGVLLKQRLRLIAPTLDTVELSRAASATYRVYVLGEVGDPGMLEFPQIPTVWDVLRAAGGPLNTADLRKARLIREEDGRPGTVPMDLSRMLEGTDFPVVALRDGDTLIIPVLADGVSGIPGENGVKVFGSVGVPSIVPLEGPTPLMDVLMLAGSPTVDADVQKIWWVHHADGVDQARRVDLRLFLERGNPAGNPLIHPGDTVNVTTARAGSFRSMLTYLLATAAAVATLYIAVNQPN